MLFAIKQQEMRLMGGIQPMAVYIITTQQQQQASGYIHAQLAHKLAAMFLRFKGELWKEVIFQKDQWQH